jgi:hypothetical protein
VSITVRIAGTAFTRPALNANQPFGKAIRSAQIVAYSWNQLNDPYARNPCNPRLRILLQVALPNKRKRNFVAVGAVHQAARNWVRSKDFSLRKMK